ncbi:MAG: hypothetical protein AAGH81_12110 [Bacteroidota bacterium]
MQTILAKIRLWNFLGIKAIQRTLDLGDTTGRKPCVGTYSQTIQTKNANITSIRC